MITNLIFPFSSAAPIPAYAPAPLALPAPVAAPALPVAYGPPSAFSYNTVVSHLAGPLLAPLGPAPLRAY